MFHQRSSYSLGRSRGGGGGRGGVSKEICDTVWRHFSRQWLSKCRANFTSNHTDRSHFWGPVHSKIEEFRHSNRRFIKGCIILYIVRIFSSSELVEPHIIPLKVRLAVALKEEAKWQVFVRDCEHWILLLYRILILYWAYTCNSVIKSRKPIKGFV